MSRVGQIVQQIPLQLGENKALKACLMQVNIPHCIAADSRAHQCAEHITMRQGVFFVKMPAQAGNRTAVAAEKVLRCQILGQPVRHGTLRSLRPAPKSAARQERSEQCLLPHCQKCRSGRLLPLHRTGKAIHRPNQQHPLLLGLRQRGNFVSSVHCSLQSRKRAAERRIPSLVIARSKATW